jgi:ketosteroid isomerase-like protein
VSQENVDAVLAVVGALNRREWDTEAWRLGPEFEYDLTRTDSPLRGTYSRVQMSRVVEEFLGPWESVRYEPDRIIEQGDRLVIPFTTYFRGRQGIELETRATWLWELRDGEIVRLTLYQDFDEALADAGIRNKSGGGRLAGLLRRRRREERV